MAQRILSYSDYSGCRFRDSIRDTIVCSRRMRHLFPIYFTLLPPFSSLSCACCDASLVFIRHTGLEVRLLTFYGVLQETE
jgi:hypothetical protein